MATRENPNAFDAAFLEVLSRQDAPASALEAERAGPWEVVETPTGGFAVIRAGAAAPTAVFFDRDLALLAAAVLPGSSREPLLVLDPRQRFERTFTITCAHQEVGWVAAFEPTAVAALNTAAYLVRSPAALALVLEAAGQAALTPAGALLAAAVAQRPPRDSVEEIVRILNSEPTPELRAVVENAIRSYLASREDEDDDHQDDDDQDDNGEEDNGETPEREERRD